MKEKLTLIIDEIVKDMLNIAGVSEEVSFTLVIPEKEEHGDFACNAAMQLVRYLKKNPKMIAEESLLSKDGRSLEETSREITTLQEKISIQEDLIRRAEEETKLQEKYNEKRMKKEEKIAERSVEKENNAFLKELLDSTKKD